jgi:CRISPR-associated endonuclease/helicase Cas3
VTGFRVARVRAGDGECSPSDGCSLGEPADAWVRRTVFVLHSDDDGPTSVLAVDGCDGESALEDDRAAANVPQSLEEHQAWVDASAQRIAERVGLSGELAKVVSVAGRLHDEGKRPACWQRAFNAPDDGIAYAKTRGPIDFVLLDGYRHELGSLPYAQADAQLRAMSPGLQELVLHLIAAHHGFARPVIGTNGCGDAPPSLIEARAAQVMHRFMRLQQRWGPWGLAWWESLVRAADQEASRRNQQRGRATVPSQEASPWR